MKIRLLHQLPVELRHGMTKGRVLEVTDEDGGPVVPRGSWWVMGDAGERVKVLRREAEVVPEART